MSVVETWLNNVAYSHSQSESTKKNYYTNLNRFLSFIGKTAEQILDDYENTTDRKFKRKYAILVRAFISAQMKEKYTVGSVGTFVCAIKSFFKYNDLPLGHVPIAKGGVMYHNRDIMKEEIRLILSISRPRDRAFFCMMAQSGLRPYTLVRLKLKHVEPELSKKTIPCKIDVPEGIAKGKYHGYFTFMAEESIQYLEDYLRTRTNIKPDSYLFTKRASSKPITTLAMSVCFKTLINKLKTKGDIDFKRIKDKPAELRLYSLRKWFRKQAGHAGFDYVSFWMGHTSALGVDLHYFSKDVEHHRKLYAEKAMPHLRLSEVTSRTNQTKEIEQLKTQVEKLERWVKLLRLQLNVNRLRDRNIDPEKLNSIYSKNGAEGIIQAGEALAKHDEKDE